MGYNIEISFNIFKNSSASELKSIVTNLACNSGCNFYYDDYEYDKHTKYPRSHCVINFYFEEYNIHLLTDFLKNICKYEGLYVESVFEDYTNTLLYASTYYITQKMDKGIAHNFKLNKRKRSYSEDEQMIINILDKK
jgi:hypothetical protein